ncbi:MAG: alanine--tRNA ligase [Bacteroidia bacterium]|nr:alanine--tRNA ligase [Bacteroidia bacterium]MCZ2277479.1 alanine--tRNA ligase [Bacteroidia bacterium]
MTSAQIRQAFLDFFKSKAHQIVASAPIVIKNDPTLMFTNAGMNQFKDWFLGNEPPHYKRIADTQKCLRVSGKHNDLEAVGTDTYHHTMFEMLGNWSFGDYFKKDAIAWAWELLTEVYKIPKDRLYVTVFEGDKDESLPFDQESYECWRKHIAEERILKGTKADNFWEMGDTGPCGPCSEIHVDLREDAERKKIRGDKLVNANHHLVIEIWNLVFMEFNRKADGNLELLPAKHVDTGMGFERLCMVLQQKQSNYDTDVFTPLLNEISQISKINYGVSDKSDIAFRVCADHIRAISCVIADGQLPSNNKAGYVIRRILRRAVRYGYTFLNQKEPFLFRLIPVFARQVETIFPEVLRQVDLIQKVVKEEEASFLRTLENGIKKFDNWNQTEISGEFAFELYDTYGFPFDLTQLLAREKNMQVDMEGFHRCLLQQKERSRADAETDAGDWIEIRENVQPVFVGYEQLSCLAHIVRYREISAKGKKQFQVVLDSTPFYAESGGQVGDTGFLIAGNKKVAVTDTKKENNLIVHFCNQLPDDVHLQLTAQVDENRRRAITSNHSATHLMHAALRSILGTHVAQKGSLVNENVTRFDFSHFSKVTEVEITRIEQLVNEKIMENILLDERRNVPIREALELGAMALFGEKYGELVRVITFDKNFSVELCGGTHVTSTAQIGLFKIISESSVAAGVRRVEAITGQKALSYLNSKHAVLDQLCRVLNNPKDTLKAVSQLQDEIHKLRKENETLIAEKSALLKDELKGKIKSVQDIHLISEVITLSSAEAVKNLSFALRNEIDNLFLVLGYESEGKAFLSVILSDELVQLHKMDASKIVRELAKEVQGGGGGQDFYATAGGKNPAGLQQAITKASQFITAVSGV